MFRFSTAFAVLGLSLASAPAWGEEGVGYWAPSSYDDVVYLTAIPRSAVQYRDEYHVVGTATIQCRRNWNNMPILDISFGSGEGLGFPVEIDNFLRTEIGNSFYANEYYKAPTLSVAGRSEAGKLPIEGINYRYHAMDGTWVLSMEAYDGREGRIEEFFRSISAGLSDQNRLIVEGRTGVVDLKLDFSSANTEGEVISGFAASCASA